MYGGRGGVSDIAQWRREAGGESKSKSIISRVRFVLTVS